MALVQGERVGGDGVLESDLDLDLDLGLAADPNQGRRGGERRSVTAVAVGISKGCHSSSDCSGRQCSTE